MTQLRPATKGGLGVVVTFVAYSLLPAALRDIEVLNWIVTITPGAAAFYVGARARRRPVLLATLMAVVAGITVSLINYFDWLAGGLTDFPGVRGTSIVVQLQLITAVPLALLGGCLGRILVNRKRRCVSLDPEVRRTDDPSRGRKS